MKISIVSNVGMDSLNRKLGDLYDVYTVQGYNTWLNDIINHDSPMYKFGAQCIFILLDGSELHNTVSASNYSPDLLKYSSYIKNAAQSNKAIDFFVSDIDCPYTEISCLKKHSSETSFEFDWLQMLQQLSVEHDNIYIFPLKHLIENNGRNNFYSSKMWYLAGMKYSMPGENIISDQIQKYLNTYTVARKKCLVVDLDNTLWGGVIGEDGVEGIIYGDNGIGAVYKDFQIRVKELKNNGIILAIASKNNLSDVENVFKVKGDFILQLSDFSVLKINWERKSSNIREISNDLNISEDSIVFIDDSIIERNEVKSVLAGVVVPEFPQDISLLSDFIYDLFTRYFLNLSLSEEDRTRTDMYKENDKRNESMITSESYDDYLDSLSQHVKITRKINTDRVYQLIQKTNQFNLTTIRYTKQQVIDLTKEAGCFVFSASVADKFGDNGVVSVVVLRQVDNDVIEIDTLLLSCRVMGRNIENAIMSYVLNFSRNKGYKKVIGKFLPTQKNMPASEYYSNLNFRLIDQSNSIFEYEFEILEIDTLNPVKCVTIEEL